MTAYAVSMRIGNLGGKVLAPDFIVKRLREVVRDRGIITECGSIGDNAALVCLETELPKEKLAEVAKAWKKNCDEFVAVITSRETAQQFQNQPTQPQP